ncbi:MAG TPA: tagaturonate epimerase family protein, partial [Planctomycetaceae bacterium]|nr:tagaturonate epimerase family protein [Planctomycetaceae bacterium]
QEAAGRPFEIELSVDETDQPTSLAEHYIIADQCLSRNMKLVSLAPRFIGDFEKGVDFKGELAALRASLAEHAAIANMLGPYKLSLHSGSDKLSMYGDLARATQGRFHVKTAGTSYLEALRVVARHDAALFRRIIRFARGRYDVDKATYHVSATVAGVPGPDDVTDIVRLEQLYLERWTDVPTGRGFTEPGRQILHCTFGSVLTDAELGPLVKTLVREHQSTYTEVLREHFEKHLAALKSGM